MNPLKELEWCVRVLERIPVFGNEIGNEITKAQIGVTISKLIAVEKMLDENFEFEEGGKDCSEEF